MLQFQIEEADGFYHRTIHIHVTEAQLQKLTKLTRSNELDGVISDILAQSEFGTLHAIKELAVDVFSEWKRRFTFDFEHFDWIELQKDIPVITFDNVLKLIAFGAAYFVCRRFGVNFGIVVVGAGLYFLYLHLDFECRKV